MDPLQRQGEISLPNESSSSAPPRQILHCRSSTTGGLFAVGGVGVETGEGFAKLKPPGIVEVGILEL